MNSMRLGLLFSPKRITPTVICDWLHFSRPDFFRWLMDTDLGPWHFEWELDSFEYDTSMSYYNVAIVYETPEAAVMHRLRWAA